MIEFETVTQPEPAGDGEFLSEARLGRAFLGAKSFSVRVNAQIFNQDTPGIHFTRVELHNRVRSTLQKLESCLPLIEARLDDFAGSYGKSVARFRTELRNPGVLLLTADMAKGDRWTFTVQDERVQHHFAFDGDKLIEVWAAD